MSDDEGGGGGKHGTGMAGSNVLDIEDLIDDGV